MAFNRGGKRTGGGGGSKGRAPLEYVFTGTTYREVNGQKVEDATEEWQLAVTIPIETQKGGAPLDELIEKLTEIRDTNGDLGARIVLYVSPRENNRTGEEFAATNILVQPKLESKQQGRGGRGFSGRSSSGGRRDYPEQHTRNTGRGRTEEAEEEEEEEQAPPPKAATKKSATGTKKTAPPVNDGPPEYNEDNVPL